MKSEVIVVPYRAADGSMAEKRFTVFRPTTARSSARPDGKWISIALMNKPMAALEQSFLRTKATDYASFMKVAELKANSSNNTIFADSKGEIAYLHPQFIPRARRPLRLHPARRRLGSGHRLEGPARPERSAAPSEPGQRLDHEHQQLALFGGGSLQPEDRPDYPKYMDTFGENPRGVHATLVLKDRKDFTLGGLLGAAYDPT
jgi:acyl-homoserine-lactone acylase